MSEIETKLGVVNFIPGSPIQLAEITQNQALQLTEDQKKILFQVGTTVHAYIKTAKELLQGKYAHLVDLAPGHLRNPGSVLALCCEDGIIVRYEREHEDKKLITAWSSESLSTLAPKISEMVRLYRK